MNNYLLKELAPKEEGLEVGAGASGWFTLSTSVGLDITLPTTPATTPQNTLIGKVSSIIKQWEILQLQ